MTMKLYFSPGACSLAVHIALREAGQSFDLAKVDLATHTLADGGASYYDVNPRGYVPLLEFDDGSRHTEAAALLQHIADRDPAHTLIGAPRSTRRLEVTTWLAFVASELHKAFSPWLWHKETAETTKQTVRDRIAARFAEMDRHLASREYLAGEFSVADAYAFTIVNWSNFLGLPLSDTPHLKAYLARVSARPQVLAALKAEGLAK
jgi:glutathione S-transferase